MIILAALVLAATVWLSIRQLRRDPRHLSLKARIGFDALFVLYSLTLAYLSWEGLRVAIDPVEQATYGVGIAAGVMLLVGLAILRLKRPGRGPASI